MSVMFRAFRICRDLPSPSALFLALLLAGCAAPTSPARATSFFDIIGYDGDKTPGGPWSESFMERRLLEEGYTLTGELVHSGPVDIANVQRRGDSYCLVLDVYTGALLQTFVPTPVGWRALNHDAPGPGFPGYPPFPDARYAPGCAPIALAAPPPVSPPPPARPVRRPKRRIHRRPPPACRPAPAVSRAEPILPPPKVLSSEHASASQCVRPDSQNHG